MCVGVGVGVERRVEMGDRAGLRLVDGRGWRERREQKSGKDVVG